jgi:hypothetical protein
MNRPNGLAKLFLLTATLLLLAPAGAAEARAQATVITSSTRIPIEFFNANSCTGDEVTINGTSHLLFHANGSPGGHSNEKLEINFALQGVSAASGVKYVVNETVTATTQSSAGGAFVFNTVGHLNVISQGGTENLRIRTEIHATFNANGELTSSKFVFTVECQG